MLVYGGGYIFVLKSRIYGVNVVILLVLIKKCFIEVRRTKYVPFFKDIQRIA